MLSGGRRHGQFSKVDIAFPPKQPFEPEDFNGRLVICGEHGTIVTITQLPNDLNSAIISILTCTTFQLCSPLIHGYSIAQSISFSQCSDDSARWRSTSGGRSGHTDRLILRTAINLPPGNGTLSINIDGETTQQPIHLPHGASSDSPIVVTTR